MPKIEVEEGDLRASQAVMQTVNEMLANPESRKLVLQARKIANPKAPIPEYDATQAQNEQLQAIRKELAEDRAAREKERAEAEERRQLDEFKSGWEKQKAQLRAEGWTDEGIANVEKHAQERGIADLEIAATHWEKLNPPPAPVQPNGFGSWGFFDQQDDDDKFVKAMLESRGEDEGALHREVQAALQEARTPARR